MSGLPFIDDSPVGDLRLIRKRVLGTLRTDSVIFVTGAEKLEC